MEVTEYGDADIEFGILIFDEVGIVHGASRLLVGGNKDD